LCFVFVLILFLYFTFKSGGLILDGPFKDDSCSEESRLKPWEVSKVSFFPEVAHQLLCGNLALNFNPSGNLVRSRIGVVATTAGKYCGKGVPSHGQTAIGIG
jgi:hypothetical protein